MSQSTRDMSTLELVIYIVILQIYQLLFLFKTMDLLIGNPPSANGPLVHVCVIASLNIHFNDWQHLNCQHAFPWVCVCDM